MPLFAKNSYAEGDSTLTILTWRFLIAALCLFLFNMITKRKMRIGLRNTAALAMLGGFGVGLTSYLLFRSYHFIPTGTATTLHFIYPAAVTAGALLIYREKLTLKKTAGLAAGMAGLVLLTGGVNISGAPAAGCLPAALSGLTYTAYILGLNAKRLQKTDAFVTAFYVSLSAFAVLAAAGAATGGIQLPATAVSWAMAALLGVLSTFGAILLFILAVHEIGPSMSSILSMFEPLTSVAAGLLFMGETVTAGAAAGMALILAVPFITCSGKAK